MPADNNPKDDNNQNLNTPQQSANSLTDVSSSDAPPLPPGVNPMSDATSPRIGREDQDPSQPQMQSSFVSEPAPNMPPPLASMEASSPPPQPTTVTPEDLRGSSDSGSTVPPQVPSMSSSGPKVPKKILLALAGIIGLLIVAVVVIQFVLPLLNRQQNPDGVPIKQTEVVWWGLWEDQQIVAPIINRYQEQNPGIKITYIPQSKENYRERLTSAFARGEGPDIFRFHNSWVPMFSSELDIVPDSVITSEQFSELYYPVMTRDLLGSEGLFGIPLEYDGLALFVNDEIFTTFGKTPPATWNEFEELAIDMTVRDTNGIITQAGAALGNTENVDHWQEILGMIMIQNGVNLRNIDDLNSEFAAQALQFYTDFVSENEVWDETQPNSTIAFAAGKLAMYFGPSWRVFEIAAQNPDLKYRVVPVPQIPKEDGTSPDITYATYWVEGVSADSDVKNEAWSFIRYLSEADTLQDFYASASQVRMFGEPYPRQDMRPLLINATKVGGFLELAPTAQSWYLASRTWDGETGINTRISQYYEDAVNGMLGRSRGNAEALMTTVANGVRDVFVQYGLVAPRPATTE